MSRRGERGGIEPPERFLPGIIFAALKGGEQLVIGPHGARCLPMAGGRQY